eukprot:4966690-Prymnesium_polylepis.1
MAQPGEYSGLLDALSKTVRTGGPLALWTGCGPATIKLAPHTVISFVLLDNLSKIVFGKEAM